ncbi:hypothetical protein F5876DRAFT_64717 [Lentinula aff. lateritia]|uniref:Uncharacterized protein n=1 Tax=Lentinula aff. lateritia TaxID=2804960 RepID=A0ACC1U373_9AGAR|nr:hypothetical protein F5876DRAFT_64717 [Lentinula aff. lateritia]
MPAPAVYVIAVLGTVAAGFAFKEYVYDPHIKPKVRQWQMEFAAGREARRRRRMPVAVSVPVNHHTDTDDSDDESGSGKSRGYEMETLSPTQGRYRKLENWHPVYYLRYNFEEEEHCKYLNDARRFTIFNPAVIIDAGR